jgi:acetyl esterase/lipase
MTDRSEIEAIRALLSSQPRPAGWAERRQRLDEVGSAWPVAEDIKLSAVDLDGVPGEWSIAPGSDESRVLMFFHGGGYCSGSIASHRRMVTEAGRSAGARTLAVGYRLAPEHPFPAAFDEALVAWRFLAGKASRRRASPSAATAPAAASRRRWSTACAQAETRSPLARGWSRRGPT